MVVYLDLFFLLNFCVDSLCLSASFRLGGIDVSLGRLVLSSSVGAAIACAAILLSRTAAVLVVILALPLLVLLCLPHGSVRDVLILAGVLLLCGAMLCGICLTVFSLFVGDATMPLLVVGVSGIILFLSCCALRQHRGQRTVNVSFDFSGKTFTYLAYYDSGNLLTDPLDGSGVAVFSGALARRWLEKLKDTDRLYSIPVSTVSGSGSLACFRAESVRIGDRQTPVRLVFALSEVPGASRLLLPASAL